MNKMDGKSKDLLKENIEQLKQLFPEVCCEDKIDFDKLKQVLGEYVNDDKERYNFTWNGKGRSLRLSQTPSLGTLRPCKEESKDWDLTQNLYIEGDNLEVLKLLQKSYYGKVKMIYIDPPYNTGSDLLYNDKFSMTKEASDMAEGAIQENGERFYINKNSDNRFHANWLNLVYPRLLLSKDLLCDNGVVFISIDNHEIDNLLKICDEIFGQNNRVGCIANVNNPKGRSDEKNIATAHEYLVVYQKSDTILYGFEPEEKVLKRYNKEDELGRFRYIDLRKTGDSDKREDRPNMFYYFLYNKNTNDFYPTFDDTIPSGYIQIKPKKDDESDGRWRVGIDTALKRLGFLVPNYMAVKKRWTVMEKDYLSEDDRVKATSAWTFKDVNSERGTEQFTELGFVKEDFLRPKPVGTIMRAITLATKKDDIVLDFFSGSGTTAQSLFMANIQDAANRKFILIQTNEEDNNITDIGKKRIHRAGEKIKSEHPDADIDIGFKVFRTADTNIKWNSIMDMGQINVNQLEYAPDLVDFMPGANDIDIVYELMLRQRDVALSETLEQLSDIGSRTYLYASSYLVCLEITITEDLVSKLAKLDPLPIKFIFRDSAFKDDISLKDETFRKLKALIEKNAGASKPTYTVEFI